MQATHSQAAVVVARTDLEQLIQERSRNDRAPDLRARAVREEYLGGAIDRQSRIVQDCEAALASAYERVRHAAKETMALERLKQRRLNAHREEQQRAEQAELDESNMLRALKQ